MRKEFEMSEKDREVLLEAMKPVPMIALQCGTPPGPQEGANAAWASLGQKMGFEALTVKPVRGKGERFFTAETARPSGVVIVFDGPPEHESGRFVEVERDGASIGFGRWVEHGAFWYLAIQEELDAAGGKSSGPGEEPDKSLGKASEPEMTLDEARAVAQKPVDEKPVGLDELVRMVEGGRRLALWLANMADELSHSGPANDLAAIERASRLLKIIQELAVEGSARMPVIMGQAQVLPDFAWPEHPEKMTYTKAGEKYWADRGGRPNSEKPAPPKTLEELRAGPQTYDIPQAVAAQRHYCREKGLPNFVGGGGCLTCKRNVFALQKTRHHQTSEVDERGGLHPFGPETEHETGISVEEAGATLVTGCPHCHRTFCE